MSDDREHMDVARSAQTGRFVSEEEANANPDTTVVEEVVLASGAGPKPAVGRIVHYVSYGTPGGEYQSQCRAAIITETMPDDIIPGDAFTDVRPDTVGLCILNPTGQFFNRSIPHDEDGKSGGTWHWPERV